MQMSRATHIGDARPISQISTFAALVMMALMLVITGGTRAGAQAMPGSFAELAEELSPAVVNITTSQIVTGPGPGDMPMVPEGSPFEDFFRDFMDRQRDGQGSRRASALGSGFIISADGYIVTNNHVIEQADEILIELFDGQGELPAEVVGTDPRTDIALLKVEPESPLPFVSFGDSDAARVGDWVLAIGNPLGQGFSVSAGIVSARARQLQGSFDDFIQTDAAINRGNSGGPLFNMDGDVIGVNTAILSPNGGSIGIGFAMSSQVASSVIDQLRDFGETRRGWLGVRIQPVDDGVASALGLDMAAGALVADVPPGPASTAGIRAGDVILTFDGREVDTSRDLPPLVAGTPVGKEVEVGVFREGEIVSVSVELGRLEEAQAAAGGVPQNAPDEPQSRVILGLTMEAPSEDLIERFGLPDDVRGLVVTEVDGLSEAAEKGVRPGDVITEVGQRPISSPDDMERFVENAVEAGQRSILMLVRSQGASRFIALDPSSE